MLHVYRTHTRKATFFEPHKVVNAKESNVIFEKAPNINQPKVPGISRNVNQLKSPISIEL